MTFSRFKFLVHFKTDSKFLDLHKDDLSNALEENAEEETPPLTHLLEAFGPGTFATLEEMARYFFSIFVSFIPFFVFGFLVTFGNEVTNMLCNLCFHFSRQDGQDGKIGKKI